MHSSSNPPEGRRRTKERLAGAESAGATQPDTIGSGGAAIDIYLLPKVRALKESLRLLGNPLATRAAAESLAREIGVIPRARRSFQYSRLQSLIADMYIDEGLDAASLAVGLSHIETALETVGCAAIASDEVNRARVYYALQHAVLRKALGQFDDAIAGMRVERQWFVNRLGLSRVDLLLLDRQEVMMHQEIAGFARLAEDAPAYAHLLPLEYYRTLKRIFEFALNRVLIHDARDLFPAFRMAFRRAAPSLPLLHHVSFAKNIGHYRLLTGEVHLALRIWGRARYFARSLRLWGQERQISALVRSATDNGPTILVPFLVGHD